MPANIDHDLKNRAAAGMKTHTTIFVSSTFRDMLSERDVLRSYVQPKLNHAAAQYGQSVSFCDLRWGVSTDALDEAEAARKVLEVCLDEIDRSNPPMLVMLGDRYGWVPPEALIARVAGEKGFSPDDPNISATALEIEYSSFARRMPALFYFRRLVGSVEDSSYASEDEYHAQKLDALKRRIHAARPDSIRDYSVRFGPSGPEDSDIRRFADRVFRDLNDILLPEWQKRSLLTPEEREQQAHWRYALSKKALFRAHQADADRLLSEIRAGKQLTVIKGLSGSGKSTLFGYLASALQDTGYTVLPLACGITSASTSALGILKLFVRQLETLLGIAHGEITQSEAAGAKRVTELWRERLDELTAQAAAAGHRLMLMVDAVDQLTPDEARDSLCFIPALCPGVHFLMTCLPEIKNYSESCFYLHDLVPDDKLPVIRGMLAQHHKELSADVVRELTAHRASGNPLHLSLQVQRLLLMDRGDFELINRRGGGMDAITARQIEIIRACPASVEEMGRAFLDELGRAIRPAFVKRVTEALAVSRFGLRMDDLARLLRDEWSPVDFAHFISCAQESFLRRADGRFDFLHKSTRTGILRGIKDAERQKLHRAIFAALGQLDPKDPIRIAERTYHGILGGCARELIDEIIACEDARNAAALAEAAQCIRYACIHHGAKPSTTDVIASAQNHAHGRRFFRFLAETALPLFEDTEPDALCVLALVSAMLACRTESEQIDDALGKTLYFYGANAAKLLNQQDTCSEMAEHFLAEAKRLHDADGKDAALFSAYYNTLVFLKGSTDPAMLRHTLDIAEEGIRRGCLDERRNDKVLFGPYLGCMGEIYSRLGDYARTEECYRRDLAFRELAAKETPGAYQQVLLAGGLSNVGSALLYQKRFDEAIPYLSRALDILSADAKQAQEEYAGCREADLLSFRVTAAGNLGAAQMCAGNCTQALPALEESFRAGFRCENLTQRQMIGKDDFSNFSTCLRACAALPEGRDAYRRSFPFWEDLLARCEDQYRSEAPLFFTQRYVLYVREIIRMFENALPDAAEGCRERFQNAVVLPALGQCREPSGTSGLAQVYSLFNPSAMIADLRDPAFYDAGIVIEEECVRRLEAQRPTAEDGTVTELLSGSLARLAHYHRTQRSWSAAAEASQREVQLLEELLRDNADDALNKRLTQARENIRVCGMNAKAELALREKQFMQPVDDAAFAAYRRTLRVNRALLPAVPVNAQCAFLRRTFSQLLHIELIVIFGGRPGGDKTVSKAELYDALCFFGGALNEKAPDAKLLNEAIHCCNVFTKLYPNALTQSEQLTVCNYCALWLQQLKALDAQQAHAAQAVLTPILKTGLERLALGSYTGQTRNGLYHGQGTLISADGTVYTGQWLDGQRSGYGEQTWDGGESWYRGQWEQDQRSGYGETSVRHGMRYRGQWRANRPNGFGIKLDAFGEEACGIWENGSLVKKKPKALVLRRLKKSEIS